MNKRPIETAHDPDLRGSLAAMQRAAQRARDVARMTGTQIVVSKDGAIAHLAPDAPELANGVRDNFSPAPKAGPRRSPG